LNVLAAFSGYDFTPASILAGVESLVLLGIGIRVVRQRSRSSPALRRFSAMVLVAGGTLGAVAMACASPDAAHGRAWVRLAILLCPWIPLLVYGLVATGERHSKVALPLVLSAAALSVIGFRTTLLASGFHDHWWGRYPRAEPLVGVLVLYWFSMIAMGAILVVRHARSGASPSSRLRLREMRTLLLAGALGGLDFIPAFGVPFPPVGSLVFVIVTARAALNRGAHEHLFPVSIEMAADHVVDAMADAVVVVDANGRIVVVNHALESMLGYSDAEVRGETLERLVHESAEDTSRSDRMRAVLQGRTIRDIERVFRTSQGEPIPVSVSMSAMNGEEGGIVLVVRDIRARKASETEVKRTAALLRSILDSTHDAILVLGPDGRLLTWNHRLVRLFGLEPGSVRHSDASVVLEMIMVRLKNPAGFAEAVMKAGALVEDATPHVIELIDGRTLECASVPHRLEGETIGRVLSLADVTEKRRAEQALRDSERRYRLLFERNAAGVYRALLDGRILDCNDAYARMFGHVRASDLIGGSCLDFFFDAEERDSLVQMLREVGSLTGIELRLRRRDGREIWVMENLTIVDGPESGTVVEGTLVDISSLKIAEEQMEFQAYHDVLTVLPNRRLFIDRLTLALAHTRRTNSSLAVMFIDLDHFKTINDTLGHTAGDELLLAVAERLRQAVREEDTVARIGGDEFTILTSGLKEPQDAIVVAEKILVSVARPVAVGGTVLSVTASIGIAFYPDDGEEPEALLKTSDSALYRAKELGRNNYQLCTPQLKVRVIERVTVEAELRESMGRGELILHYQPIVRLDTGQITAVEALVRWNHPKRGLVMPPAFMGIAEESRLSLPLDLWVIEEACRQLLAWQSHGFGHLTMCVNLSRHHLQQKDLPKKVEAILADCGVAPERIEIEVTEEAILAAGELGVLVLRELREMGVSVAIDDFGTGYTSLNNLRHLPIDSVKIDSSMVANLPLNAGDAAIVTAIVNVARLLNLRVVAEGVETAEQVRLLRERRCNEVQGHLFSAALPASLLEEMLLRSGSADPVIDVKSILTAKA
jgi:diguanylate cyclase (GGDEF)-like protein/PAS domain S-box-containing protein